MKKQVPEGNEEVRKEQVRKLMDDLVGNQVFGRHRGRFLMAQVIKQLLDEADSPTDFLRRFDDLSADSKVLGNLLAKYRRDGLVHAEEEFLLALSDSHHVIPGEAAGIERLSPYTLVIFEPEKTLAMLDWICYDDVRGLENFVKNQPCTERTQRMFQAFPSLLRLERERSHPYPGRELLLAHSVDVMTGFPEFGYEDWQATIRLAVKWRTFDEDLEIRERFDCQRQDGWVYGSTFAFLVPGDQGKFLSRFPREKQAKIGTWQVFLPQAVLNEGRPLDIGLHPEEFHGNWQWEAPAYTSRGLSHGYGAIVEFGARKHYAEWLSSLKRDCPVYLLDRLR